MSSDGGIDGIVDQDALGLSRIYVQAKRYDVNASVGRPEIQGFVGGLAREHHGRWVEYGVVEQSGGSIAVVSQVLCHGFSQVSSVFPSRSDIEQLLSSAQKL